MVKGQPAGPGKAGSKGALHSTRVVFVNKTATVVHIAINGSEQIVDRAICGYCAYGESDNRQRQVNKLRYCFHVFLSFIIPSTETAKPRSGNLRLLPTPGASKTF
jgi:hypothetical protein